MIIVWSGLGILIPIAAASGAVLASLIATPLAALHPPAYVLTAVMGIGVALACCGMARWLDGLEKKSERTLYDTTTGQPVVFRRRTRCSSCGPASGPASSSPVRWR